MPDVIFAIDFDTHIDHKATDLFFEEALCNVLKNHPDYHPTVYKGFGYGTAFTVTNPTGLSYGYQLALRQMGKAAIDIEYFLYRFYLFFYRMVMPT